MNVSPHINVLSTLLTAITMVMLFYYWGLEQEYFLLPLLVLALIHASILFKRQLAHKSVFSIQRRFRWRTLLQKSLARYLVWLLIILSGNQLYQLLPYYSSETFAANRMFFDTLLISYLWLGFPYFMVTLTFKSSRSEDFYDPAIRLIHISKQIGKGLFSSAETQQGINTGTSQTISDNPFLVLKNPTNRKVVLNLVMRAYFIPIMIVQVLGYLATTVRLFHNVATDYQVLTLLFFISAVLWLMDIINAALNYCLESRWLENRSRSIDLTFGGWLVCLACYEPLNQATGYMFPFAPFVASNNPQDLIIGGATVFTIIKMVEILALSLQVYSNVSLGSSIVNITLKKLQTRGPYGLVRHPGTSSKLLLWFTQAAFYQRFWSMKFLYGYVMWGFIYVMRAFTEERHLKKYPEYVAYMKKVKKRFIPGLF